MIDENDDFWSDQSSGTELSGFDFSFHVDGIHSDDNGSNSCNES